MIKGTWEIFDKNRIQNYNLDLIDNTKEPGERVVMLIFLGECQTISIIITVRKQQMKSLKPL